MVKTKSKPGKRTGRPKDELPRVNATPKELAKALLKQRPLRNVEADAKRK
ncbi:MAG: hypothetical protein OXC55_02705 [Chloroflexi bacterium]|nr:hypothetical protein [Chloroflexota bacterium]